MTNIEADVPIAIEDTPVSLLSDKNRKLKLQVTRGHQNWTIENVN